MEINLNDYVTYIKGNLSIIIVSPHGGDIDNLKIPTRSKSYSCGSVTSKCHKSSKTSFVLQNDGPLTEIAHYVYVNICNITQKRPYMIVNNIKRKDVDMNRNVDKGSETDLGKKIWNLYFDAIDDAIDEIKKTSNATPILIDLHSYEKRPIKNNRDIISVGYGLKKKDIIALSNNKNSNLERFTMKKIFNNKLETINDALYGDNSLGTILQNHGLNSFPSNVYNDITSISNFSYYSGGYTVKRFKERLASIQIELPEDYLNKKIYYKVSVKLAMSIVLFFYKLNGIPINLSHLTNAK